LKKKISRIMGVGLAVVIVTSLLIAVLPVSAGTLSWSDESLPSTTSKVIEADVITDMAIGPDGSTIYTTFDTAEGKLYKSTDGGAAWSSLTSPVDAGGTTDLVAVAPDDADMVVVVDNSANLEVWVSVNGGSSFTSLGTPQDGSADPVTVINDVTVSRELSGKHYIAIAGNDAASGASIHYFNWGATIPEWLDAADGDWNGDIETATTALAVAFSPNFPSDRIIMAVTTSGAAIKLQVGSFSSTKDWNDQVSNYADYPLTLDTATAATAASIAVDASYLGSDDATRLVFIGTSATGGADDSGGLYALDDTSIEVLKTDTAIKSVAFNTAATKLLAGASTDNKVYRSSNPTSSSPDVNSSSTYNSPGEPGASGTTGVIVGWTGDTAVAASGGTSGAFSVSADDGKNFKDISLVNTSTGTLGNVIDVAISPDGSMMYLVTTDANATSLWRNDGSSWARVLTLDGAADHIVRPAPDDWDTVYLVETGSTTVYFTDDGGEAKWTLRYASEFIQDLAVESTDVAYAAISGAATVSKTDNGGFIWDDAESTGMDGNTHMIVSLGEDLVLVGGDDGEAAYSNDGNDSWEDLDQIVDIAGGTNVVVTATGLEEGDYIYAAVSEAGDDIYRLEIGVDEWDDIIDGDLTVDFDGDATADDLCSAYGIALVGNVLYVSASDGTDSILFRTLSASSADDETTWSSKMSDTDDGVLLNDEPQGLFVSTGSTKLWALDTNNNDLYSFSDTTATEVPVLAAPSDGFSVAMNPQTGRALDVAFNWDRLSKSTDYDLKIALDPDFEQVVRDEVVDDSSSRVVVILGPYSAPTGSTTIEWMSGETYYWKVRASSAGPLYSNWSAVNSFTVEEAAEQLPPVIIEQGPAPVIEVPTIEMPPITVTIPDIILPTPAAVPDIVIPQAPVAPAPITPAYIWAIVIIGAILVIAVVVLIVRTRRPV